MSFYDEAKWYCWVEIEKEIESRTSFDVERALMAKSLSLEGLISLLSPAAAPFLEKPFSIFFT
jgi:2-iminoacetate synthase